MRTGAGLKWGLGRTVPSITTPSAVVCGTWLGLQTIEYASVWMAMAADLSQCPVAMQRDCLEIIREIS